MPFAKYLGGPQPRWDWEKQTNWCAAKDLEGPEVLLRQVGPNRFQLVAGFRYVMPEGEEGGPYDIPAQDPTKDPRGENGTDLASVPSWLWWFIASYGRHSRAALMHDHLIGREPSGGDDDGPSDKEADTAFRMALRDSKVPILRRWLMWDAVSLATMWRRPAWKLVVLAFALSVIAFVAALGFSIYSSWQTIDGVLAWPFEQIWTGLDWVWTHLFSSWVGWLWSALDWPLQRIGLDDSPWWKTALIGLAGLAWRKRWLITLVGLVLIVLPTITVWASRVLALLIEGALVLGSPVEAVHPTKRVRDAHRAQRQLRGGRLLPDWPSFGDPYRQQGGPI